MAKNDQAKTLLAQGWLSTEADMENPIPNEGDEIVGVYFNKKMIRKDGSDLPIYQIRVGNGNVRGLLGGAILNDRFSGVPVGSEVYVRFDGEEKATQKGRSPMKMYTVLFKPSTNATVKGNGAGYEAPTF